jgi:hypothetical protein
MATVCVAITFSRQGTGGLGWAAGGGPEKFGGRARAASRSTTVGKAGCPIDDDGLAT